MKKSIILVFGLVILSQNCLSNNKFQPKIDERIELTSIFCHLIGFNDESNLRSCDNYSLAVKKYFAPYKKSIFMIANPRFAFIKYTPNNHQAIVSVALKLKIEGGEVIYDSLDTNSSLLEQNYSKEDCKLVIKMLSDFYKLTNFEKFFKSQQEIYRNAEELYNKEIIQKYNSDIFKNAFGSSSDSIRVYLSMINGKISYSVPNKKSIILGVVDCPSNVEHGYLLPIPMDNFLNTMTDVLIYNEIKDIDKNIYKYSFSYYKSCIVLFDKNNYEIEDIFNKQLSKLFIVYYFNKMNNSHRANQKFIDLKNEGFMWSNELLECLETYENSNNDSPYFNDFLPVFINRYCELLE